LAPAARPEQAAGWRRRPVVAAGLAAAVLAVAVAAGYGGLALLRNHKPAGGAAADTARATRDRLLVTITETGEVEAKRSVDIKCEVEGQSTIIWVIEEGTVVQPGQKLMQLDAADLEEQYTTRKMAFDTANAAYERARQQYEIQKSTNESLLADAGLKVKFALLDLMKYLGTDLAQAVIAAPAAGFDKLSADPRLGGQALQEKRRLESDIDLAGEELSRATVKAGWTRTLKEKGYVTGSELEADELAVKRRKVELEQARTALDLFLRYEFPKQAEQAYTNWQEAKRELVRVEARAASELASAKADLDAKQAAFDLEKGRFAKAEAQLQKTLLVAPQAGMVVYARSQSRWNQESLIEVGAIVRHQQTLIQLPDLSEMKVSAKVHESVVRQVADGAIAYVTVDAWPDRRFTGRVTKVAVMPDRSQWFLNPGLKTYVTDVTLDSTPPGLKPGMNAQVEVLVADRAGILQVPVSAVHVDKGYQVVYVKGPTGIEVRRVETGLSNDRAVEVLSGLSEGEEVYLYRPAGAPGLDVPEKAREREGFAGLEPPAAPPRAGPAAAAGSPPGGPSGGSPAGREALSPERRDALRRQFENATPEEREKMRERRRRPAGAPAEGASGAPAERPAAADKPKPPDRPGTAPP
jgi:HlyD family secretion protein